MDELDPVLARLKSKPDDQAAWGQFVLLTWPFVYSFGSRLAKTLSRHLGPEDIAQEVYLKFARHWATRPTVRVAVTGEEVRTLLAVIARHAARDAARHWHADRRDVARDSGSPGEEVPAPGHSPAAEAELQDLLEHIHTRLGPEERDVLTLRLQGYTVAEIGARLGLSPRTVERRLTNLAAALRCLLEEEGPSGPRGELPDRAARG